MDRALENERITRGMSLQRVGKVGGSSRSDTDGHDPDRVDRTRMDTIRLDYVRLRETEKKSKRMIRVMSLQRNRKRLL